MVLRPGTTVTIVLQIIILVVKEEEDVGLQP